MDPLWLSKRLCSVLLIATPAALAQSPTTGFVEKHLSKARALLQEGKPTEARLAVARALEHTDRDTGALALEAKLAENLGDRDGAVHAMHRWLEIIDSARKRPVSIKVRKLWVEKLLTLDPEALTWSKMRTQYLRKLHSLAREYRRRRDLLAALDVFAHILEIDPTNQAAANAIRQIRRTGGREVAVEDVYAGTDPTNGMTPEQLAAADLKHATWDEAYRKETDNYRYRTNAGFLVVETSAIAMEQMNRFYRKFFHFMEDGGKTPKIEIRIFKNRDEYLSLGQNPVEWSGGHFIGNAVETFVGGTTGKASIRDMYRTLFHEAAHQFVSLTCPFAPGWLNEAYASYFEGSVILSNGSVVSNRVPPGRLFPLVVRLENGWMTGPNDGVKDSSGQWATPTAAPRFATVITGAYQWGPPWYAPTWGVVYFLYNYRSEDGRPVYREALHQFYTSFKRGRSRDPISTFEEIVLRGSKLSPVQTVGELDPIWKQWLLDLRDREIGKTSSAEKFERFGDAAIERGENDIALELYEESLASRPGDCQLLWKLANLHETLKQKARAAARYRELKREYEMLGKTAEERYAIAVKKIIRLDPLASKYKRYRKALASEGLVLARGYEQRKLPTMALEIARRISSGFSDLEALELYTAIARRTGKSLARWRLAYDGTSLAAWSGGDDAFQAYGDLIRANAEVDPDNEYLTHALTYDVTFDGDYSLETELRATAGAKFLGLCFGRKDDQNFHAVMLHPKGFMDVISNRGGTWETLDHRSVPVDKEWHKLRIDVAGRTLDAYYDGYYVRSIQFPNPAALRGSFGLISGSGLAQFRNLRILARDRHDPAASIERSLAMERVAKDASLRSPGSFAGGAAPELRVDTWIQGKPQLLAKLKGKPVWVCFWSPRQDAVIPTAACFADFMQRGKAAGMISIVVCGGCSADEVREYLQAHPMPDAHIALDDAAIRTHQAYYIKAGGHGLPRVLLINRAGEVVYEGDPGLAKGKPWKAGNPTYLDDPFKKLLAEPSDQGR